MISGKSLEDGLRRIYIDKEVLEMTEILLANNRYIDLYVFHGVDEPNIVHMSCMLTEAKENSYKEGTTTPRRPPLSSIKQTWLTYEDTGSSENDNASSSAICITRKHGSLKNPYQQNHI